ncbi:MAG TPA: aminoacetone oxidase family FAD-binding enzyme [Holophaga sp.]|nr:aminoacetone oxidase family FAD-binding enzyme [Holophaga sp.]
MTGTLPPGPWDVVVVGGGPAGILAAGRAAQEGARVLLLEAMEKPLRKLRITGKGRANVTNMRPLEQHLREIRPDGRFLRQAFGAFFNADLVALLASEGCPTRVERGDRVFPESGRAWDAAEALWAWARRQGAVIAVKARVEGLVVEAGVFKGLEVAHAGRRERVLAPRCVLATGGLSYPRTGSTGDGLAFAAAAGHRVEATRPSLVGLATRPAFPGAAGLTVRNAELTLWIEGRKKATEFGEADFTERGLGGAAVLRLSREAVDALAKGSKVEISLDLKPALDGPTLAARLDRERAERGGGTCAHLLRAFLPPQLVPVFAGELGLAPGSPASRLQGEAGRRLLALLKDLRLQVTGHGGWEEAIVTAGGVALKEVDPRTLASRRVEGLHFAGEMLDLDANTGGYNLQIAFSTGWLAGTSAARAALSSHQ